MKNITLLLLSLLFGLLLPSIFRLIGLPTGDHLFEAVFGESTWWKGVILFSIIAIVLLFLFKNAIQKDKEKV